MPGAELTDEDAAARSTGVEAAAAGAIAEWTGCADVPAETGEEWSRTDAADSCGLEEVSTTTASAGAAAAATVLGAGVTVAEAGRGLSEFARRCVAAGPAADGRGARLPRDPEAAGAVASAWPAPSCAGKRGDSGARDRTGELVRGVAAEVSLDELDALAPAEPDVSA